MSKKKNKNWLAVLLAIFLLSILSFLYLKHGESQKMVNFVSIESILSQFGNTTSLGQFENRPFIVHFNDNVKTMDQLKTVFDEVANDTLFNVVSISQDPFAKRTGHPNWIWLKVSEDEFDSLARYIFHLVEPELKQSSVDPLILDLVVMINYRHFIKEHLRLTNEEERDKLVFNLKKMILRKESSNIFQ